jgi:GTP pyrophosphokinase
MRTIEALSVERQERIAHETAEVYAPLAHRLGISAVRSELEDIAFSVLASDQYRSVERELAARRDGLQEEMVAMLTEVSGQLERAGMDAELSWRLKHAFGVWSKMQRTGKSFEEILDVVGVRVICADEAMCYAALGVVHSMYPPVPGSFTDYIAAPRLNRYQSLHTTVTGPHGRPVEVQIRSAEMHQVAEFGVASHWAYKESGGDDGIAASLVEETAWMRRLLEAGGDAGEYLSAIHGDLARQEIYCLTPNGRLIALPEGATPVDFAYMVHTEVGDRAVGARVNGAQVGLDHHLSDGDRVEIVTSSDPERGPNLDWVNWVATSRSRSLIRRWHARHRRVQSAEVGRERIRAALDGRSARTSADLPVDLDAALESVCRRWGLRDPEALAAAVGDGRVHPDAVASRLLPDVVPVRSFDPVAVDARVLVEGLSGVEVRLANCCTPAPFDPLVGWVSRLGGVSVHRTGCSNVAELLSQDSGRLVTVTWAAERRFGIAARVRIDSFDRSGLVADVAGCLSAVGADIRAMTAEGVDGLARQVYEVTVGGSTALEELERSLWGLPGTTNVRVDVDGEPIVR